MVIFNYTYNIIGTENVQIATIYNLYLLHAMKGDTFLCSLRDGHLGVHTSIIRNAHLTNFIKTFNKIKIKIGLYKFDWLQFASANTINLELILAPDKKNHHPYHCLQIG